MMECPHCHHAYALIPKQELTALRLLANGLSDAQIAQEMGLAVGTAKNHIRHLYQRIGVANRAEATKAAIALGIAEPMEFVDGNGLSNPLSPRQTEVMSLYANGLTTREIAEKLVISAVVVRTYETAARERLGAQTREQAIAMAISRGIVGVNG